MASEEIIEKEAEKSITQYLKAGYHKIGGLGGVLGLGMSIVDYNDSRKNGSSMGGALVDAAANQVLWTAMGGFGLALGATQLGVAAGTGIYKAADQYSMQLARSTRPFGKGYTDFAAAQTMRQRSIQAIQQSRLNTRSALGNEAQYLHR